MEEGKKMKKTLLMLLLICSTTGIVFAKDKQCKPAVHAKVPAIAEFTYHNARKALLVAGWQPLQSVRWQEVDERLSGQAREFWEKGYVEVQDCAGTGAAPCVFLFKDVYGNRLSVTTAGQEYPEAKSYARVTGFEFVCD
jgi:hypothetical protein